MVESTAFDQGRVARGLAILPQYKQLGAVGLRNRPVRIAVLAQGAHDTTYDTTKRRVYTAAEVGTLYGFDSPLYQAVLSLLPVNGDGVGDIPVTVYPLAEPDAGAQAAGDITPSVGAPATKTGTYYVKINNKLSAPISVVVGETVATWIAKAVVAINGILGMPGTASDGTTTLAFTVGWEGTSGDLVHLEVVSPDGAEFTFAYTQPTGGAGVASITAALAQIGNIWETHVINGNLYTDSTLLDELAAYNEGRWSPTVRKPLRVYTGTSEATLATVTAVTDARKTDRTNIILTNPGSYDLPVVVAADQVRRIAKRAASVPAHDYGALKCPRLTPALDSVQWVDAQPQTAVLAGCSTIEVVDGVVQISDVVTCYHPTGEEPPAYRYDCDIEKISTMIYNCELVFGAPEWKGGPPLVPDNQATKEPTTKKPRMGTAELHAIIDAAAAKSLISDPDFAKANSTMTISDVNPKRVNVKLVYKLSGNANVISMDMDFGFYYGV